VDGFDGRWRIDVIEAGSPESFDPAARRLALDADMANAVAVKDPGSEGSAIAGGCSCRTASGPRVTSIRLHGSGDALSTGAVKSETGLATSAGRPALEVGRKDLSRRPPKAGTSDRPSHHSLQIRRGVDRPLRRGL